MVAKKSDMTQADGDVLLADITKEFGDFKAVDNVTLQIPQGSFFALLGPSGCGKTTTLRMIAGLEEPTAGSIHMNSQTWPSGSVKSRPYMNGKSSTGFTSEIPPYLAAALFIASTSSRESHEIFKPTSLDAFGAIGLAVRVFHFSWVSSITLMVPLQIMCAEPSYWKSGFSANPISV